MGNWTDEKFELMAEKLVERKQRESDAIRGKKESVSAESLAARSSGMIEYKKES